MAEKKELVNLNVRIPYAMRTIMQEYISRDTHANMSEFARDAIREKIVKDAPTLYAQLFKESTE